MAWRAPTTCVVAAILVVACGSSKKISLGDDGTGLRDINPDNVLVATRACAAGAAHANVCCIDQSCSTHDLAPFFKCDAGETAYPDGLRCCSLDNPSSCTFCDPAVESCGRSTSGPSAGPQPLPPTIPGPTTLGGTACDHCPPGFTGTSPSKGGCCKNSGNSGFCEASAGCAGKGCSAVAVCAPSCAPGFAVTGPQIDLCCRVSAPGSECYVWLPGDTNGLSCGGTGGIGTACACQRTASGHTLQMDCDDATLECTCSVDGVQTTPARVASPACASADAQSSAWVATCQFAR